MNILNVEKVSKTYGEKQLFDEVTLGVNKGDKIGVIGVNGTGKSTFLKIIAGLEEADAGQVVKGKGVTVAYLEQKAQFPEKDTILGYVLRGKQHSSEAEAKTILTKLGITEFDKDIHTLSGGQKKRVALAKTLVEPAEVLILDEPTNHLDNEMVIWLEDYIRQFKGELLMVTHDRYFLDNVTNRIVELDRTHLYSYDTNYSGFLELKTQREQMEMATEEKRQNILRRELEWIRRGAQARSTKQKARIQRFEEMSAIAGPQEEQKLALGSTSSRLGRRIIECENVGKSMGGKRLLRDFTYTILRDERMAVVGENGCGKTTFLRMLAGQLAPDEGTINIGETVKIGFFTQEFPKVDPHMRLIDFMRDIAEYVETPDGRFSASQMLEQFLFPSDVQYTPVERLSGGEKRRLYLASLLMASPNVLLLDEPTNDLDIATLEILEDYLATFKGAVIVVSHDRYFLDRIAQRLFAFEKDAHLVQYVCTFSDYLDAQRAQESEKDEKEEKSAVMPRRTKERELRMSYKEQKDYETIDARMEQLQGELERLDGEIEKNASDFVKLTELTQKREQTQKELDEAEERWLYLTDLAERIEAQKKD